MSVQYVDEAYTTQRCPKCQVAKRSHKDGRKPECSECELKVGQNRRLQTVRAC